ncbi:hypothetical protein [Roseateles sp. L2-2]|uniref:hypothetical protein n=1 Tax=Roseateles sp. L2-2 TaxID=3422597 RepID=UPI000B4D8C52|nr:hypothetical protein CDL60_13980 [Roseateles noduli]
MSPDHEHAEEDPVVVALTAMQRHVETMTQALCALHLQATELQSVLCAVVDTHPDPGELKRCFEHQIEHTLRHFRPSDLDALNSQTQAWVDRIHRRTLAVESTSADGSHENAAPRLFQ